MFLEAEQLQAEMIAWRRTLHQMPEVGLRLPKTLAYVQSELEKMGIPVQAYPEISCLLATLGQGENCFLLRADMDGLPIREETGLPFSSDNGNMHACGHDLHTAMLLGAAKLLKERQHDFNGRVKLLFQSGEEIFTGAKAAVDAGVLRDVRGALALHVVSVLPLGLAVTGRTPMAAVDGFQITLIGRGGHGSTPETAVDPINAGVQVYLALQALLARETGGMEAATLTIGEFSATGSANVIPQKALLRGTLRTFDPNLRRRLLARLRRMATEVATAYRCACRVEALFDCPALETDPFVTALAVGAAREKLQVEMQAQGMGSEDFARIAQAVPAAYLMLGAARTGERTGYPHHHPKVTFAEEVLPLGAAVYARTAMGFLNANKQ